MLFRSDENGNFSIAAVPQTRYQIQVTGLPAEVMVSSIRQGVLEALHTGVTVSGNPEPIEIVLQSAAATGVVEGGVSDARGQGVPSATVVLVPPADRRMNPQAFKTAVTDQSGAFAIRSIPPGDYRVLAWEDIEAGLYFVPGFIKDLDRKSTRLNSSHVSESRMPSSA